MQRIEPSRVCQHDHHGPPSEPASRRQVLAGLAAVGAATALPFCGAQAQGAPGIIDVHHHVMPPQFVATQRELMRKVGADGGGVLEWTPSKSIEEMDKNGVASALLSISLPGSWTGKVEESRRLARAINDYSATMARDHRGRFGFFATVPLPDTEGSLTEIEYALDVLKADGITLLTSYDNKWPGDPAFAPVYDELNRRKAIVYSHPTVADCCVNLLPGVQPAAIEFMFDTTRAITGLLTSGTFSRCPDIRFIFSHAGGTLPMLAGRISTIAANNKEIAARLPRGALYELQRLSFDTASMTNAASFAALLKLVPAAQVMFGSDYPYAPIVATARQLRGLGLAEADLTAIERGNAFRMFPTLKG